MRFGPRFNATCANLTTPGGDLLARIGSCRYLGVYFFQAPERLNAVFTTVKLVSNHSFDAIYGRLGRCASPKVIVYLLSSKCTQSCCRFRLLSYKRH